MNPWNSSLLHNPDLQSSPYSDWLKLATNAEDYIILAKTISGIPKPWIEWVEKQTNDAYKRGVGINKPLTYRMTALWNGIILLQETKFICDVLENSLRQAFFSHASKLSLNYGEIKNSIPNENDLSNQFKNEKKLNIQNDSPITASLLLHFTFYQVTETITRNWKYISSKKINKIGFSKLFWNEPKCRDKNLFQKDMKKIRLTRNNIAHSKTLFKNHEAQYLYEIACTWLSPLSVELKERVLTYRRERPRFLEQLKLM